MIGMVINPGSGPIRQPVRLSSVKRNVRLFLEDVVPDVTERSKIKYEIGVKGDDGRWAIRLSRGRKGCWVDMPGTTAETIKGSTKFFPPRIYVDGNSWFWEFAVREVQRALKVGDR